jgi:hypothetical protein
VLSCVEWPAPYRAGASGTNARTRE